MTVAQANKLALKYVVETHRQEDFVVGSAEPARLPGAKVVSGDHELLSGMTAWRTLALPTKKDHEHTITTPDVEGVRK